MNKEEIAAEIAKGLVTGICLDTSTFEHHHLSLEKGLLYRLKQFKTGSNKVYLPLIVKNEVLAHLIKKAEESQRGLKKALKDVSTTWNTGDSEAEVSKLLYGDETPESISGRRLETFIEAVDAQIIDTSKVSSDEVFRRYFAGIAPFTNKETKKHEFPDAFSLIALEALAEDGNTKLIVVSDDKGWHEFCAASSKLVCVPDLVTALSCFQDESARYACSLIDEKFLNDNADDWLATILTAIDDELWDLDFFVEAISEFDYEHDVEGVTLERFEIEKQEGTETYFQPVDLEDGDLVTEVSCKLHLKIEASITFSVWDSVDKEKVALDTRQYLAKAEVSVQAMIGFDVGDFHLKLPEKTNITYVGINKETVFVDLGQIHPDFDI